MSGKKLIQKWRDRADVTGDKSREGALRECADELEKRCGPMVPAAPKFAIGDRVSYRDHHNRDQVGEVLNLSATWSPYLENGDDPAIYYVVRHPTYANNRHCAAERDLSFVE